MHTTQHPLTHFPFLKALPFVVRMVFILANQGSSQTVSDLQKDSLRINQLKVFLYAPFTGDLKDWETQLRSLLPVELDSNIVPIVNEMAKVNAHLSINRSKFSGCQSQLAQYLYFSQNMIDGLVPNLPRTYTVITSFGHKCIMTKRLHSVGEVISGYFEHTDRVQLLGGAVLEFYVEVQNDKTRACEKYRAEIRITENDLQNLKNKITERVAEFEKLLANRLSASRTSELLSRLYRRGSEYLADQQFDDAYVVFDSLSKFKSDYRDVHLLLRESLYKSAGLKITIGKPNDGLLTLEKLISNYGDYKDARSLYLQCMRQSAKDAIIQRDHIAAYTYLRDALLSSSGAIGDDISTHDLRVLYQDNEYEINRFIDRGFMMFPPSPPLIMSYVQLSNKEELVRIGGNLVSNVYDNIINNNQLYSVLPSSISEKDKSTLQCFDMTGQIIVWKNKSVPATKEIVYTSGQLLTYMPTTVYTGAYQGRKDQGFISKINAPDGKLLGSAQSVEEVKTSSSYGTITMLGQPLGSVFTAGQEYSGKATLTFYDLSSGARKWTLERFPPQFLQRWGRWTFLAKLGRWNPPHQHEYKEGTFFFRFDPAMEQSVDECQWCIQEPLPTWANCANTLLPCKPHPYRIIANKFVSKSFVLDMISGQVLWQDSIPKARVANKTLDLLLAASDKCVVYASVNARTTSGTIHTDISVRGVNSGDLLLTIDPATFFAPPQSPSGFGASQGSTNYQCYISIRPADWDSHTFDFDPPSPRLRPLIDAVLSRDMLFVAAARIKAARETSHSSRDSFEAEMVVAAFGTSTWKELWRSQIVSYRINPKNIEPFHYRGYQEYAGGPATFPSLLPTLDGVFASIGDVLFFIHNSATQPKIQTKEMKSSYEWGD